MIIPGVSVFLGACILLGLLMYPLRRWARLSWGVGVASSALLIWTLSRWPLDRAFVLGGRTVLLNAPLEFADYRWALSPANRPVVLVVAWVMLMGFAGVWFHSPGRTFVPLGLVIAALWISGVTTAAVSWVTAALALVACLSVFIVQAGRPESTRPAVRQLWWPLVALPLLWLGGWYADEIALNPENMAYMRQASVVAGLGLLLLLAPVPFHVPTVTLLENAPPVVGAFLLLGGQTVVLYLVWLQTSLAPWMGEQLDISLYLAAVAIPTLLWGAAGAVTARRVRSLWAYSALHDWGVLLLGLSLGAPFDWATASSLLIGRMISVALSAYGIASLLAWAREDDWQAVQGLMHRRLWTTLAVMVGGLGLAGFPLTASFGPRWILVQTLLGTKTSWALWIVLGQIGVTIGYLRLLYALLSPASPRRWMVPRERWSTALLLSLGVAASGLLALAPQWMDGAIQTVIGIMLQGRPSF
ncbi:MAG: hypothetical protein Kow0047_22580 [Anaerolineae bacterium]